MRQVDVDFYSDSNARDFYDNLADKGISPQSSYDSDSGITTVTFYDEK